MKEVTIKLYTAKELKEQFPEGYNRAYREFKDKQCAYYWLSNDVTETIENFLTLFECKFQSWNAFGYSNDRFRYDYGEVELEINHEFEMYDLNDLKGEFLKHYFNQHFSEDDLKIFHNYGDCPLTGVCFDHEPLRIIHEYLVGNRPESSLTDLIDEGLTLLMDEVKEDILYQESEEFFLETSDESDNYFTEEGQLFV